MKLTWEECDALEKLVGATRDHTEDVYRILLGSSARSVNLQDTPQRKETTDADLR